MQKQTGKLWSHSSAISQWQTFPKLQCTMFQLKCWLLFQRYVPISFINFTTLWNVFTIFFIKIIETWKRSKPIRSNTSPRGKGREVNSSLRALTYLSHEVKSRRLEAPCVVRSRRAHCQEIYHLLYSFCLCGGQGVRFIQFRKRKVKFCSGSF